MSATAALADAEAGVGSGAKGGIFGALLGGALGYVEGANIKTVKPWYETTKGLAIAGGSIALIVLLVIAYRKKHHG